jgi:hypothetical protein
MGEEREQQEQRGAEGERPMSPDSIPHEEVVADLLKVKRPGGKAKPKKAQSRERKKRNVGPFE